jgi:hypothetical protein
MKFCFRPQRLARAVASVQDDSDAVEERRHSEACAELQRLWKQMMHASST